MAWNLTVRLLINNFCAISLFDLSKLDTGTVAKKPKPHTLFTKIFGFFFRIKKYINSIPLYFAAAVISNENSYIFYLNSCSERNNFGVNSYYAFNCNFTCCSYARCTLACVVSTISGCNKIKPLYFFFDFFFNFFFDFYIFCNYKWFFLSCDFGVFTNISFNN